MNMGLTYSYNKDVIHINEKPNEMDVEFDIRVISEEHWEGMKELQRRFEENNVLTDVLFYPYENHHYRVIVRQDYFVDFVLGLMKYKLLDKVMWT